MKKRFFLWLARKGTKPTTWAGLLVMISSILGFELTVEQNAAIAQALAPIVGALLIFAKESGEEDRSPSTRPVSPLRSAPMNAAMRDSSEGY